ncbi:AP-5 complex subunit sigma-1-like [Apostichopus japonicus]|uniref:AP-5 complex subunit sigma-1-like n=1 Tax=Stichopus japonicus TaxID=307972 RepID=UPI003AB3B2F7
MVYSFLISSFGEAGSKSGEGEVIFTSTYGQEDWCLEMSSNEPKGEVLRGLNKEQLRLVTERVQSEYEFQQRTFDIPRLYDGAYFENLPKEDSIQKGIFRFQQQEVFANDKTIVWQMKHKLGFILILEKSENTLQAQTALNMIVKTIDEYVKLPTQEIDILLKPDKVTSILNVLLPSGRILFTNSLLTKQLERELSILFQGR